PHVRATAARLGAIQIDSVNVLARAHYLPTFSRYGPYRTTALDQLAYEKRELFEYWGHAACYLPLEMYPLLRWRMERQREAWKGLSRSRVAFMEAVLGEVAERGPIAAGDISIAGKSTGPWWGWSRGKVAVEILLAQGKLAIAGRRQFARLYDLTERVLPRSALEAPAVPERDAQKELCVRAARAMGVGTARDIAQYFHVDAWWDRQSVSGRRPQSSTQELFDELTGEGRLQLVHVEGWKRPGYMLPGARIPAAAEVRALVSPFDPVLWERKWTKSVFDFDYQIEIYVPAPERVFGYYVLPFLLGDRFAARVDLKADRKTSTLIVHSAHLEAGFDARRVAAALTDELRSLASWLALDKFLIGRKGDLVRHLGGES
ncbi:MAG: winged helix-turn-helix domain-containing protein, partial [Gemmatimonadaceae bacterium]